MGTMAAGRRTLVLVNLAAILERADEALLPAVYKEVGAALHVSPTRLGSLTLFRSIVQSSCYPPRRLHGRPAQSHPRHSPRRLPLGHSHLPCRSIQHLSPDSNLKSFEWSWTSLAFGWLQLTGNIGSILGGCFSLLLASTTFMGIAGWRIAFHVVGIISVVVGLLIRIFAVDPHFSADGKPADEFLTRKSVKEEVKYMLDEAKAVIKIPSFRIIVAQGVAGSFPWSALLFAPMWLELIGYSHNQTGILMSSAIPFAALLMFLLPDDPSAELGHALLMFVTGLSISLSGPATNSPISAEIVPEKSRTSIYALDRSFVSALSSFAPLIVGILAEHVYGYKPIFYRPSESTSVEIDRQNASSLAKALYTAIAIPMLLCCFIYSFLYCTYPRDRERARMNLLIASEMQQMELDDDHEMLGESSGLQLSEMELGAEERSVIDIAYGGEDFETDTDERALLSHKVD
ncbi:hypothetical protein OPV22_023675 [Ensete ventricosum]|uniref:Major facilitator superfamily (MFS) profile domain-containing protein n=1 Tax=Ensete ventricosum TaxID=4639 RepID=A0AAV8QSK7_ENSVE|nr:hypothetical protein OPV22_023675 [Ensete ventricosum]